eukprot:scaffold8128_cov153-Skeletonema_marinoi.AAC.1
MSYSLLPNDSLQDEYMPTTNKATQMVSHVHYNSISCVEFELSPMSILGDAAQASVANGDADDRKISC